MMIEESPMRKNLFIIKLLIVILSATVLLASLSLTAYAAPDGGDAEISADSGDSGDTPADDGSGNADPADPGDSGDIGGDSAPDDSGDISYDEPTEAPADNGEGGNGYNEYIDNIDDVDSDYEEPEHLDELPTVSSGEVVEATAVVLPDVEVTDASLFSGTVMWLCVAVGIAVVVGVMVSKRTRRRS